MFFDIFLLCLTFVLFILGAIFSISAVFYLDFSLLIVAGLFIVAGILLRLEHLEIGTDISPIINISPYLFYKRLTSFSCDKWIVFFFMANRTDWTMPRNKLGFIRQTKTLTMNRINQLLMITFWKISPSN